MDEMSTLMVATAGGLHALGARHAVELAGHEVTALAAEGSRRWAVVDGKDIWSSEGGEWHRDGSSLGCTLNCLLPTSDGLLVGTSDASLLRFGESGPHRVESFDRAPGRDSWYTPWGGPPDTRSLAADEQAVYANVHVGGILRSTDGGTNWAPTIEVDADVHQVVAGFDGPGHVVAATAGGLAVSDDAGDTWAFETEGLGAAYSRAAAVAGDVVLVSASHGPRGDGAAIYRRVLGGGTFERCREGLPAQFEHNIDTFCLAASGASAAFGTADGLVFASEDAGATWATVATGLPRVLAIVFA
jgi:photosystem II stability/assembly factor-like uncharacterized protein